MKGITDGHIWLNRKLAERGHYPAIDPLQSISRVRGDVSEKPLVAAAQLVQRTYADYEAIRDLVNINAYVPGASADNDTAYRARDRVLSFLRQSPDEPTDLAAAQEALLALGREIDATRSTLGK